MFFVVNTKSTAASPIKDYIRSTREVGILNDHNKADNGKIQWIAKSKSQMEDGIPVKDAFNNDGRKIAFLTFDDGPSDSVTPQILDILKKYNIKATFFVTGKMAKHNAAVLRRAFSEGHTIGNHSYSHEYGYLYSNLNNFMGEVKTSGSILKNILGESYKSKIFRFPGGSFGNKHASYKSALKEHGYDYINWNVSIGDSAGYNIPVNTLMNNLKDTSAEKDHIVVLMHDLGSKHTTVQALPSIIEYLKSQGYEFKKLK